MSIPQMHTTIIVSTPPAPGQLYRLGWNAYCDGIAYDTLATEDEKRGWRLRGKHGLVR